MTVVLSRAGSLRVGEVGGGVRLVRRLRLVGSPGFEATLTLLGAHQRRLRVVVGGEVLDGAGPHTVLARGRRITLGLILITPRRAGPIDCTVKLTWDGGGGRAAFEGEVVLFGVDEDSLDFGTALVGDKKTRNFQVSNRCRFPIEVEVKAPSGPFASASAMTHTIDARGSLPVVVEFEPTASGEASGAVEVSAGGKTHEVSLLGRGRSPFEEAIDDPATEEPAQPAQPPATGGSPATTGDFQRLYLHVPTKNTNVTLGKEYDGPDHDPTHAGYSATTDGHVLLRGRKAGCTMTLQSSDQGWIQSTTKDVFLGAGDGGFNFIAGGGVYVSSGKGIVLAAGHGDVGEMNEFKSGGEPPVPAIKSIGEALKGVQTGWKVAGFLMSGFGLAYTGARLGLTIRNKTKNKKWIEPLTGFLAAPIFGLVKNATMTGLSLVDTVSKEAKLNIDPILPTAGINMYAEGGFLSGTLGFCSVYGTMGASFRSANAGMLGMVNASLDSLVATGMFGFRSAGLSSLKSVTIESGFKTMIATPAGTLDIKGTKIEMESVAGMLVKGGGGVNIAAATVDVSAGPTVGASGKQVLLSAEAKQTIAVAKKYGIEITPAGVKIGNLAGEAIDPSKPMIEIGPAGVTVMGGPGGPVQLKITPAGVTIQGPGNDLRHMGMTLFARANRVELC